MRPFAEFPKHEFVHVPPPHVEPELAFPQVEVEVLLGYTLVFHQPALRVAPEALDAVDAVARVAALGEPVLAVAHPVMALATPVDQAVAGGEPVGAHDGVLGHLALDRLRQRPAGDVRDDPRVDLAAALGRAEDDRLAPRPAAPDAPHAPRSEVALVGLDLAVEGAVGLADLGYAGAEHAVAAVDRVAVEARQGGRGERRHVGAEQPRQLPELALREVRVIDVLVLRRLLAAHGLI